VTPPETIEVDGVTFRLKRVLPAGDKFKNTVEEKDPSRRIEIEDIERKGNVVYVHCAIKSIIKP